MTRRSCLAMRAPALALALGLTLTLCGGVAVRAQPAASSASGATDFSAAEKRLLMSDQLSRLKRPTTLGYTFRKTGTLETGFEDRVRVQVRSRPDGGCCAAEGEFLSGERRLALAEIEQAQGNPVILYFLEHDIREMQRQTKGSASYFRKRIRMALYESAKVREVQARYRDRAVPGHEIVISPYLDDPNRARFPQWSGKQYVFVLSNQVPGQVVSIRSTTTAPGSTSPLLQEELTLDPAP